MGRNGWIAATGIVVVAVALVGATILSGGPRPFQKTGRSRSR